MDATTAPGIDEERPRSAAGELRALLRLAFPIALTSLGQALMGWVDIAVAGRGSASLQAAAGLGNTLYFVVATLGMGLMLGLDPLISQAAGAGEWRRARSLLWQGGWLAGAASGALAVLVAALAGSIPWWGLQPLVASQARDFLLWRIPSIPLLLLFIAARSFLQGLGRPRVLVWATVAANVVNLPATWVLTFGGAALPEWVGPLRLLPAYGAAGASAASSLAMAAQLGLALWAVRAFDAVHGGAVRRLRRVDVVGAAKVGAPIGLQMAVEVGVFAAVGVLAGRLGAESLAAHQIALSYASLTFCVALGIGTAGSVRVGWAVGAGDTPAARRAGFTALGAGAAFMACGALVFVLFPEPLARLSSKEPAVIATAAALFWVSALFQVADGLQGVGAGVLRGAGDTRFTLYVNVFAYYVVGLPLGLLVGLRLGFGVAGLWWGLCAGLFVVAISLVWRFHRLTTRVVGRL